MAKNDYKKEQLQKKCKMQNTTPKEAPENYTKMCEKKQPDLSKQKKKHKKDAKCKKPCQKRHQKIAPKFVKKT